jgi:3D (Asp-Asp-Asp) domain-containing protein
MHKLAALLRCRAVQPALRRAWAGFAAAAAGLAGCLVTGAAVASSASERPPRVESSGQARTLTVLAMGYTLRGRTATGIRARRGVVAVDPAVIPLGTRLTIPGYGNGVAADIGASVRGAAIDVWFPTRARALAWGERRVTITLH